jgi:hypothetical protein
MIVFTEFISGMMLGLEFIDGGVVVDLFIIRVLFLRPDSPYVTTDIE